MSATSPPASRELASTSHSRSQAKAQSTPSALAITVSDRLARSGQWSVWLTTEARLSGFASLEDAVQGWRRRDARCYQVVAGLTALGSRRGGDDDAAALAVVVMLQDGVIRVAATLSDVCEVDDVTATVWEEVKSAEPQLGCHAARYLLQRARQRLSRPAAGMVPRVVTTSLEQCVETTTESTVGGGHVDRARRAGGHGYPLLAVPEAEDPLQDLTDLLVWARGVGVIAPTEVDLLIELLAAENGGLPREDAQRLVGERHGVAMRTIRRRRDATAARLRKAAPQYLAAIS